MTDNELIVHLTEEMAKILVGHTGGQISNAISNLLAGTAVVVIPENPYECIFNVAQGAIDIIEYNKALGIEPRMIVRSGGKH